MYPKDKAKAIFIRSDQDLDSTMYPANGSPKKGPIAANIIIPIGFLCAT